MTTRSTAANLSPAALIRGAVAPEQQQTTQQSRTWRAMESAITLGILLLVIIAVSDSIAAANWVEGMPDVRVTALLALGVALGLSRHVVPWAVAYAGSVGLGVVVVCWQLLRMEHFTGQIWFWERFIDLRFRLEDWFTQAFNDGITTDNVPFVFFIVVAVWLATCPRHADRAAAPQPLAAAHPAGHAAGRERQLPGRPAVGYPLRLLRGGGGAAGHAHRPALAHDRVAQPRHALPPTSSASASWGSRCWPCWA